ncbi:hypothetical protein J2Z65_001273 [Paenibacillus aceris]|uniref:Uncharacterized protein n=1 Tax=Paenibacillus aceris TaxID=869555 RepID=A0ABS4HU76_9BACL|nr:hypothetical protein [Paenibacillus aceris]
MDVRLKGKTGEKPARTRHCKNQAVISGSRLHNVTGYILGKTQEDD